MRVLVLGAGIIGVSSAWHLMRRGHDVTLVERQADAALETSFANAGQISVSYCEPWARPGVPLKVLRWLGRSDAPLLWRPQLDWRQWAWCLRFLGQCTASAFERNVAQLVALGRYSHEALHEVVRDAELQFQRQQQGIAHWFSDVHAFAEAAGAAEAMARHGLKREVLDRDELLRLEPALHAHAERIVGGTYCASDEHGDARLFTQGLARACEAGGVRTYFGCEVLALRRSAARVVGVQVRRDGGTPEALDADAVVVACGSYSAPLLRTVGVGLPIYPGKGYSATLPLLRPQGAPRVSLIDDQAKIAVSRLGQRLRVAGTIELGGFDLALDTPLARRRCAALLERVEQVYPGVADTRLPEAGGEPAFWCGLRPATPTNIPYIGRTAVEGLWVNAGHGTLGWTHGAGSGKALAELMSGRRPGIGFRFMGEG